VGMVTSECGSVTRLSRAGRTAGARCRRFVLRLTRSIDRRRGHSRGRRGIGRIGVHGLGTPLGEGQCAEQDHQGDTSDGQAGPRVVLQADDGREDEQRDQVHDLDHGVQRRSGRVLERVTHRVADDGGLVGLRALAPFITVLDVLLGIVPRTTRVRQRVGQELAREDRPGQESAERQIVDPEAHDDRSQDGRC
jgi:hypothetical protein